MNTTFAPSDRVTTPDGPGTITEPPFLMSSGWTVRVDLDDKTVTASGHIRYGVDEISAELTQETPVDITMALPHTYTDEADHTLKVTALPGPRLVTKMLLPTEDEQGAFEHFASVTAPKGADAVALARAVLEAAGDTGHRVVSEADLIGAENAVVAMRQRAAYLVEYSAGLTTRSQLAAEIRALPLLPDA